MFISKKQVPILFFLSEEQDGSQSRSAPGDFLRALWSGRPDVQAGFRKGRGTRDQIANIHWITGKARKQNIQKNICFCFNDYSKACDCVDHSKLWKILRDGNTRPPDLPPVKSVCWSRSNI